MTKTETNEEPPSEVEDWRLQELRRLGFTHVRAEQMASVPDVAHQAARMLEAGCSHLHVYLLLREP